MTNKHAINKQFTNFAFTLAETLIVMGIIGVVAALTLPNLNSSTGGKEKVAKLQKIYSNLNDAYGRAISVYGPISDWFGGDSSASAYSTRVANRMIDFLKVSKNCGYTTSNNACFFNDILSQSGGYNIFLSDGAGISIRSSGNTCSNCAADGISGVPENCVYGSIYADIDGPNKGKNQGGVDIFQFYISKDGIIPAGGPNDVDTNTDVGLHQNCIGSGESWCATGFVLHAGNMEHLKCGNSLGWSKTTCK
ncbi:type II secretion system protein [bacterium]|nr:type II secretion system protein [bacterium]